MNPLYIILAFVVLALLWLWVLYNSLVRLKVRTDEAWSDIEVQMKRRYDLIPNLLETVKGYASHERGIMEKVSEARAAAMGAQSVGDKAQAENMLSETLKSLFAVSENYPDLKANQNFLDLQHELRDAEDKIMAARRFYNANVRDLNTKMQTFPNNLIAQSLGFSHREFFELGEGGEAAREPVPVKF